MPKKNLLTPEMAQSVAHAQKIKKGKKKKILPVLPRRVYTKKEMGVVPRGSSSSQPQPEQGSFGAKYELRKPASGVRG